MKSDFLVVFRIWRCKYSKVAIIVLDGSFVTSFIECKLPLLCAFILSASIHQMIGYTFLNKMSQFIVRLVCDL